MMMDDRQSMSLSFPIRDAFFIAQNESEIQEIDEIELTPQIRVQEEAGEISISGNLLLKGKYVAKPDSAFPAFFDGDDMDRNSYAESIRFSPFNIRQSDFIKEPPLVSFEHKIPIHIQIAKSRIENLQHIFASIDSFDYEIESSRKLAITAELILNGIKGERRSSQEEEMEIPHAYQYISSQSLEPNPETASVEPENEEQRPSFEESVEEQVEQSVNELPQIAEEPVTIDDEEQSVPVQEIIEEEEASEPNVARVSISGKGTKLEPVTIPESKRIEPIMEEEAEISEEEPERIEKEGASYLTSFLRSSDDNFTRLKMCILQKDETLDTIAERYQMAPDEIVRANNGKLGSSFTKGQVIYIPVKSRK